MSQINRRRLAAFTLVELLVVVTIIAVLIGILIPVIAKVKVKARAAETQNFIQQLSAAIEQYHNDHRAYPGPLSNDEVRNPGTVPARPQMGQPVPGGSFTAAFLIQPTGTGFDTSQAPDEFRERVTMSENLVLGLLGGLRVSTQGGNTRLIYDPSLVGNGATSLNVANPKKFPAYLEGVSNRLSWRTDANGKTGRYMDGTNLQIDDTLAPEFVDTFTDPMPVLYWRAKNGVPIIPSQINGSNNPLFTNTNNSVITDDPNFNNTSNPASPRPGPYDLSQNIAYTASYTGANIDPNGTQCIGVGKTPPPYFSNGSPVTSVPFPYHGLRSVNRYATATQGTGYYYPLDAFPYFENPASKNTARNKDSYILISAGIDRMYGTNDDIVSFGSVQP